MLLSFSLVCTYNLAILLVMVSVWVSSVYGLVVCMG